jgi:hypothetical protein
MVDMKHIEVQSDELSLFSDDESVGSIFSSFDEAEDDIAPTAIPQELDSGFKRRDELLEQLVRGIDPKYAFMINKIEQAVRVRMMCRFSNQHDTSGTKLDEKTARTSMSTHSSSNTTPENESSAITHIGWMERVKNGLPFGMVSRGQGLVILLLNCVAYNAGESIIRSMVVFLSRGDVEFENQTGCPICMMLVTFVILCLTGGIYDYVNDDILERVKENMRNRLLLRKWDARIFKWFRRHEALKTTLNVMSFFTFVYSVYAYQEQFLGRVTDMRQELFQGLPSNKLGVITYPSKLLARGLPDSTIQLLRIDATCVTDVCVSDEFHEWITRQDEAYLASEMSADSYEDLMGNPTAVLVTESFLFWYYLGSVVVAIALLRMMGHKFWSI